MASWSWGKGIVNKTPAMEQDDKVQNVQARIIQQQYVRAAVKEINTSKNWDRMTGLALTQLTKDMHDPDVDKKKKWTDRFKDPNDIVWKRFVRMQQHLQTARLTINFTGSSWFSQPNEYQGYTQMYERAVTKVGDPLGIAKEMRLKSTGLNPALTRDQADTTATFREESKNPKIKLEQAGTFEALKRLMDTGGLNAVAGAQGEFTAKNPYFNPKSKQVFAALDYGMRPHGACFAYGMSFMVLRPKFMTNAIYFAHDTFSNTQKDKSPGHAMNQVSFDMMGALYGQAKGYLKTQMYNACVLKQKMQDPPDEGLATAALVESHLFEPLTFSGNIQAIYLSPRDKQKSAPKTGAEWDEIQRNAAAFAKKHGAELTVMKD